MVARGLSDSPTILNTIRERDLATARARLEHHDGFQKAVDKWRDQKWLAKVKKAFDERRFALGVNVALARQIFRRTFTRDGISLKPSPDGGKIAWQFSWNYEDIFNEPETSRERTLLIRVVPPG